MRTEYWGIHPLFRVNRDENGGAPASGYESGTRTLVGSRDQMSSFNFGRNWKESD
jgi:hypothetical protein